MTNSSNSIPDPTPFEKQLKAVVEGVTRSLTHFSNVYDRMRRHHRDDHREALALSTEIEAKIVKGHLDDQERHKIIDEKLQDLMHEVVRNRALMMCTDDQNQDN